MPTVENWHFFLKKMPALTGWHLIYFDVKNYFAGVVPTGAFWTGAAGVGVLEAGASVLSIIFESLSPNDPPKLKLESKISTINIAANVQVLLSKKSVVFCTPPICVDPPNDEESPPPLGFWTIITTTSKKQTIVIKTKKIENVLIV